MARYYLAPSLVRCRDEINLSYPNRDRGSDGWIGDPAHWLRGAASDHNPSPPPDGVVRAIDVDKDGIDPMALVAAAIAHPAVNYVIFDGSIWSRSRGFRRAVYTGTNKHEHHVHISLLHTLAAEVSGLPWLRRVLASPTLSQVLEADMNLDDKIESRNPDSRGKAITVRELLQDMQANSATAARDADAIARKLGAK